MVELAKTRTINGQTFTVLWSGKYLSCDLAIVTADPKVRDLAWAMIDPLKVSYEGTVTIPDDFDGNAQELMKITLDTIEHMYIAMTAHEKQEAIASGHRIQ